MSENDFEKVNYADADELAQLPDEPKFHLAKMAPTFDMPAWQAQMAKLPQLAPYVAEQYRDKYPEGDKYWDEEKLAWVDREPVAPPDEGKKSKKGKGKKAGKGKGKGKKTEEVPPKTSKGKGKKAPPKGKKAEEKPKGVAAEPGGGATDMDEVLHRLDTVEEMLKAIGTDVSAVAKKVKSLEDSEGVDPEAIDKISWGVAMMIAFQLGVQVDPSEVESPTDVADEAQMPTPWDEDNGDDEGEE